MFAQGRLGASFCSRDFEDQSDLKFVSPTLPVQLARNYAESRSTFVPLAQSDPGIAYELPYGQMDKMIVQPLAESDISTVIVLDALDECKDDEPASTIPSALEKSVIKIPKAKVTGHPEPRIRIGLQLSLLAEVTNVFVSTWLSRLKSTETCDCSSDTSSRISGHGSVHWTAGR